MQQPVNDPKIPEHPRFRLSCEFVHVNDPPDYWTPYDYPLVVDKDTAERLASEWRANPRYRNVQAVEVPNAVD